MSDGAGAGRPLGEAARRLARSLVLWAGPLAIVASLLLLTIGVSAGAFRHGPGAPTAGTGEAWALIWVALALVGLGIGTSFIANLVWLGLAVSRRRSVRPHEWARAAFAVLLGGAFLFTWFKD